MKTSRRRFLKIAAAQSAALLLASQTPAFAKSKAPPIRAWNGIVLGAEASIQLSCDSPKKAETILKRCVSEIQRLERIFSLYDEQSSLARLNKNKQLRNAPTELLELLQTAKGFSEQTHGAFDVTVHPLVERYRTHFQNGGTGLPAALEEILQAVNYRYIEIENHTVKLANPQTAITLNGIAQGYITDKIAELLRSHGIGHTLIDMGEKRALDTHPSGRPWNLALANQHGIHDIAQLDNQALSSSGGYGTPFDDSGTRHHLIDPRTGLSVNQHNSVHVIADCATTADALSTALATCTQKEFTEIEARFPQTQIIKS